MYRLTMLPYEPGLCTVLNNPNLKTRLKSFNYTRSDSSIFKKVCSLHNCVASYDEKQNAIRRGKENPRRMAFKTQPYS